MAVTTKKLLQSSIARQLQSAAGTFNLLNCASADQQRHASSHSENTNTFIKEVSIATILQIHT
jgi:hypothetical protein